MYTIDKPTKRLVINVETLKPTNEVISIQVEQESFLSDVALLEELVIEGSTRFKIRIDNTAAKKLIISASALSIYLFDVIVDETLILESSHSIVFDSFYSNKLTIRYHKNDNLELEFLKCCRIYEVEMNIDVQNLYISAISNLELKHSNVFIKTKALNINEITRRAFNVNRIDKLAKWLFTKEELENIDFDTID